ncbi:MAG: hypothetical protein IPJ13_19565 [Saprospiraceae bacterium]|nr:hypothetical protein [Saprospiraceae bacterium]
MLLSNFSPTKFAFEKELSKIENSNTQLSTEEIAEFNNFFMRLNCENPELFHCFEEANLNPNSAVDLFLNDLKQKLLSDPNILGRDCNNLAPYTDRWYELATFNALSVPSVKTKLEQLGSKYWIQTLENANNTKIQWFMVEDSTFC